MLKRALVFSTAYLPLMGGAEVALKELTDRLSDEYEFDIVCARLKIGLPSKEKIGAATVHRVGVGSVFDKLLLPFLGPLIALRLYGLRGPDFLWSMQASYGGFASLFYSFIRPKVRFLLTVQEGDPPERYARHAGFLFRPVHRAIFRRADHVQSISRFLSRWATQMGFTGKPTLIPNGVDLERFLKPISPESRAELRRQFGFRPEDVVVISVSRLSHKNGLDDLLRALPGLPSHVKVLLIGDGEDRERLRWLTKELGIEMRVVFAGGRTNDKVPELLRIADIFVRASRSEGQGISFLEAMVSGLPTVGTPVGGIPDFLTEETGWVCQPGVPESITEAIQRILAMPKDAREAKLAKTVEFVRREYDWKTITEEMRCLFDRVVQGRRLLIVTGIYPPDIGGPATYVPILAKGLVDSGDRITVATFGDQQTPPGDGWHVSCVSKSGKAPWRYLKMFFRVLRLAGHTDLVYAQTPSSDGFPASLAAAIRFKPFALKVVGDYAWEAYQNRETKKGNQQIELLDQFLARRHDGWIRVLEWMERFVASRAEVVVVPSQYLGSVVARWGVPSECIRVIYNAVPIFPASATREALRHAFGIEQKRVLFTVVRFVPWKGVGFLLRVLKRLSPETLLVIAGDGPMRASWEKEAYELGVTSRVRFLGSLSKQAVADWNVAADAFALASGYEGYPHVVVEALMSDLHCFVTDQAGNKEMGKIVPDGVTVLKYCDEDAWVGALSKPFAPYDSSRLKLQTFEGLLSETRTLLHSLCVSSR